MLWSDFKANETKCQNPTALRNGKQTNLILGAMAKANFTKREFRVLVLLLRQTHGYKRAQDTISLKFWTERTALGKTNICNVLSELVSLNVVAKDGRKSYSLRMPEEWSARVWPAKRPKAVAKITNSGNGEALPKAVTKITNSGNRSCQKRYFSDTPLEVTSKVNPKVNPMALNAPYEETLKMLLATKSPQVALYERVRANWPDYPWDRNHIGHIGEMIKHFGLEKVLSAIWVAQPQRPVGNPLAYVKAILLNNGRPPKRVEATRGPEDFKGEW